MGRGQDEPTHRPHSARDYSAVLPLDVCFVPCPLCVPLALSPSPRLSVSVSACVCGPGCHPMYASWLPCPSSLLTRLLATALGQEGAGCGAFERACVYL